MRNGLEALSADVVSKTGVHQSFLDVLRPDMDRVSPAVIASTTAQASDSKLLHSIFNPIKKEVRGLQDQLSSFEAIIEKLRTT